MPQNSTPVDSTDAAIVAPDSSRLRRIIGRVDWQQPEWFQAAQAAVRRRPGFFAAWLAAVLGIAALGYWIATRPTPVVPGALTVSVNAPQVTDYTKTPPRIDSLGLVFSGSAAPLKAIGQAPTGVTLEPELPGTWQWVDDHNLQFTPANDWPIGQEFFVRINAKTALARGTVLADEEIKFSSAGFTAFLAKSEFYLDPVDPALKKAVYELNFSHPVDPAQLERRISFKFTDGAKTELPAPGRTITYDEHKLKAWIHSEPLKLPDNGGAVDLTVEEGVSSSLGGEGSKHKLVGKVTLPSLYSVQVNELSTTLVDNERFEPEQVLVLNFNNAMRDVDVAGATKVWLLPAKNPAQPADKQPAIYSWDVSEVDEKLLGLSRMLPITALPTEREFIETHSFRYHAPPGRFLYVRVGKGLKAFGGFMLGDNHSAVQQVPQYPQLLRFLGDGALLSLRGERRVSIVSRNVTGARLEVSRVLPEQLQHLAFANQGSFAKPEMWTIEADSLVERQEIRMQLPAEDPAKAHYEGIDLSKYLTPGRHGVFLLSLRTMSEYDARLTEQQSLANNSGSEQDSRLVVLTDLGIIAKRSLDGSRDVFVQSLAEGTPVAGARVRAIARNGETLAEAQTDADGRARLPSLNDFKREKQPVMLTIAKGDDFSFLPIDDHGRVLDFSRFDIGGEANDVDSGDLSAFLFSDRGLYRPGDTINLGMIVRAADWKRALAGLPLEAVITDPRGSVARRERLTLGEAGFESLSYTPSDSAPSGTWQVSLYLIGRDDTRTAIGETSVQVREFAPDTLRVQARLSSESSNGWIKPDKLSALVSVENLFGTPAQQRKVEATLVLRPAFPSFAAFPDYKFYDPQRAKEGYDESLTDGTTDKDGKVTFPLDLSKYAKATYQLNFLARAFEPGSGRNVAAQTSMLVSGNDYLVGIKSEDDLNYVKRGGKRAVSLLALGPNGRPVAVGNLQAVIVEKRFVSVLTRQNSGLYRYVSQERRYPKSERALTLAAAAQPFALPTDQPGDFVLEVRSADGTVQNQIAYSVAGAGNVARSLERNAELALKLDKPSYSPGDTIEISVRAPYAGSGLITIERDRVYAQVWFRSETTSSVQKIKVPADFEGNGYVNVQFLRDPSSDEIFMSPLTYGVAPFAVDRSARTQPLKISLPPVNKPGKPIPVQLSTEGKARVILFAVDEGILQVARYRVGDPLDHFFRKKMLQVDTAQILDLLLPEFSRLAGQTAPGGDGEGDLAKNLNPFKRKAEKPAVWWSGPFEVDGKKTVNITLPDHFNGQVRVVAVAVTAQRMGLAETRTLIRGDFVLTPTVPTHVAPGDEFELPVGVSNTIAGAKSPAAVTVSLKLPPALTLASAAPPVVTIEPGGETVVRFRLRAGVSLGAQPVVIIAQSGKFSTQRRIELSLRPAIAFRQDLRVGRADQRIVLEKLRPMFNQLATRKLSASASPLVAVDGLTAFLRDYPHLCTEQLLSEAFPALVYGSHPELGKISIDAKTASGPKLTDVLRSRQNSEGGIGVWVATPDADPFVSAYAGLYLLEARQRGHAVPDDMLKSLNAYLETLAANPTRHDLGFLRARALAVYLLIRQGRNASTLLGSVQEQLKRDQPKVWQNDPAGLLIAASYQLLQQDAPARPLAIRALTEANAVPKAAATNVAFENDYEYYYDSGIDHAWTVYLLNRHFPKLAKQLKPSALDRLLDPMRNNSYNTLSAALTVLAFDAYAESVSDAPLARLSAAGKDGKERNIGSATGWVSNGRFTAADLRLWVTPAPKVPAWYVLNQSGYDRSAPVEVQDHGLEVLRDYLGDDGKPVTSIPLGGEVTVRLRVRSLGEKVRGDIAIIDLLPGGFEVVMQQPAATTPASDEEADGEEGTPVLAPTLALPGSSFLPQHVEPREDRVVLYGYVGDQVTEYRYKVRATNNGSFIVPPIYAESMYERSVYAQGGPAGKLQVTAAKP